MNMSETAVVDWCMKEFRIGKLLEKGPGWRRWALGTRLCFPSATGWVHFSLPRLSATCLTAMAQWRLLRGLKLGARVTVPRFQCLLGVFQSSKELTT